jgi:hypothetical protein
LPLRNERFLQAVEQLNTRLVLDCRDQTAKPFFEIAYELRVV